MRLGPAAVIVTALLVGFGCESAGGVPFGGMIDGRISSKARPPFPIVSTFAFLESGGLPTIADDGVQACIQRHMESHRAKRVELTENPQAIVTYRFETSGSNPVNRKFTLYVLDAAVADRPEALWFAEVTSQGRMSDLGPLSFTFLDQAFLRYGRSVTREPFVVSANTGCAARGALPK